MMYGMASPMRFHLIDSFIWDRDRFIAERNKSADMLSAGDLTRMKLVKIDIYKQITRKKRAGHFSVTINFSRPVAKTLMHRTKPFNTQTAEKLKYRFKSNGTKLQDIPLCLVIHKVMFHPATSNGIHIQYMWVHRTSPAQRHVSVCHGSEMTPALSPEEVF